MVILIMKVMLMMVLMMMKVMVMVLVMMMISRGLMRRRVNIRNQLGHVAFLLQTLKTVQKEKFIAEMK